MPRTVVFTFAGRQPYLKIQQGYVRDLLDRYEDLEYHLWNFSRNEQDDAYVRALAGTHPRIRVFNQFYEGDNPVRTCVKAVGVLCPCVRCRVGKWSEPYKYYAQDGDYRDTRFVKVDDDVVFLETGRFDNFLEAVDQFPRGIVSAKVVNNGLCTLAEPPLMDAVLRAGLIRDPRSATEWWMLCTSLPYLEMAHRYFLDDPGILLRQEPEVLPLPRTRFSINTIGFGWKVMRRIAAELSDTIGMGDEEIISTRFDIHVVQGFLACHLHYSDQRSSLTAEREQELLDSYREVQADYLATAALSSL